MNILYSTKIAQGRSPPLPAPRRTRLKEQKWIGIWCNSPHTERNTQAFLNSWMHLKKDCWMAGMAVESCKLLSFMLVSQELVRKKMETGENVTIIVSTDKQHIVQIRNEFCLECESALQGDP